MTLWNFVPEIYYPIFIFKKCYLYDLFKKVSVFHVYLRSSLFSNLRLAILYTFRVDKAVVVEGKGQNDVGWWMAFGKWLARVGWVKASSVTGLKIDTGRKESVFGFRLSFFKQRGGPAGYGDERPLKLCH